MDGKELLEDVPSLLRSFGVDDDEIAEASELGTLELLALERILEGPGARYDLQRVTELTNIPSERVLALWRALGFPEPRPEEQVFTDLDVEMLIDTMHYIEEGQIDIELTLQMTRVIGSSIARISTALVESITAELDSRRGLDEPGADTAHGDSAERGSTDAEGAGTGGSDAGSGGAAEADTVEGRPVADGIRRHPPGGHEGDQGRVDFEFPPPARRPAEGDIAQRAAAMMPIIPQVMEFVWRRHTANAARRRAVRATSGGADTCVGFADLVGFTARTQQLDQRELADVVGRFELIAHDLVTRRGGRVIKMIGDEVMFSADDICDAIDIALDMADTYGEDEALSDVRVGLASGEVLERDGDLFGPVVNMASRIVKVAYPGAVVVSSEVAEAAEETEGLVAESIRSHYLKDIGKVSLSVIRRTGSDAAGERALRRNRDRDFVLSRRRGHERDAVERSGVFDDDLGRHLADGSFLDDPTEELEMVTDAVLNAEIDVDLQIDLLTDIESARRLDALEREAVDKADEADAEAERKVTEIEQEARRRVTAIERESRRRIEAVIVDAEARAARANDAASRKVEALARDAERKANQAERGARRQAERRASKRRRSVRSSRREDGETGDELREAMEDVAEVARHAAERARSAFSRNSTDAIPPGAEPGGDEADPTTGSNDEGAPGRGPSTA